MAPNGDHATELYLGTSGWAYPSWKPDFYPPKTKSKDFLRYYSSQLNSTEVNYTFRRLLTEKTIQNWLAETPADFRFVLKANYYMTHIKRLKDPQESIERFLTSIQQLFSSGRMGPVLFQLPPDLKADLPLLKDFLSALPRAVRSAWEFRHDSWFTGETYQALGDHNASLCIAESEKLETPKVQTAKFTYYRFRKPGYTRPALERIAEQLAGQAQTHEVYAFFKHEEDPQSAVWAADVSRIAGVKRATGA